MQFCSKCGKEIADENSLFCENCGEKLYNFNQAQNANDEPSHITIRVKKTISPIKIGMCIIALFFAISLCFLIFHKSDEEKILNLTNDLAVSMNEGDYKKMLACFEPSAQNQADALMNIGTSLLGSVDLKDLWSLGSIGMSRNEKICITVYDITVKNNTASADISFSFDEGKKDNVGTVKLIKIKGKWYFKDF